jgi:hypothetical protein
MASVRLGSFVKHSHLKTALKPKQSKKNDEAEAVLA